MPTFAKFELPDERPTGVTCRACGEARPFDEYRVFSLAPKKLLMDFCVHCERKQSTIQLYRRFNAYGTPEITEAVFRAERVPEGKRNIDQTRLLVASSPDKPIESTEQLLQVELQRRELSRRRLLYYVTTMMPEYMPSWAHQDICRRLERFMKQVELRESPRLMLFMQPRIGKSKLASDMFPSWLIGHHPEWEVIASSYAQSLPLEFSRNIRDRLGSPEYKAIFPKSEIRSDARGIEAWKTTSGGGYLAAGVGTGITGKGFHCFVSGTMVATAEGAVPIERVGVGAHVLSYDHATNRAEYRQVLATRSKRANELVKVTTASGRQFVCTPEHRVYSPGAGYREAAVFSPGDGLVESDGVRVWGAEVARIESMPRVLQSHPQSDGVTTVRAVRQAFRALAVSARKGWSAGVRGCLLLAGVFKSTPRGEKRFDMCCMPATYAGALHKEILLEGMSCYGFASEASSAVRVLHQGFSAKDENPQVLHRELQERAPLAGYDRSEQLELQGWAKLRTLVSRGAAACYRAGPRAVCSLFSAGKAASASCGRGPHEQPSGKPRDAVLRASQGIPQRVAAVASVSEILTEGVTVYDIQVEGNSNFFAEEVLVHNCGLIDDPIKDDEEASSDLIRDNTFKWYQSTFRTRAAPGAGILYIATRWHHDDPAGRLLAEDERLKKEGVPDYERENWEVVSYPAIAEGDEYLMRDGSIERDPENLDATLRLLRKKGDALHPERVPLAEVKKIRNTFTKSMWSAMYQQAPTPDDGDFFKRDDIAYRWLDPAYYPFCRIFMTADYAISKKNRADYTVVGVFALDSEDNIYVLQMRRGRWGTQDIVDNVVALASRYKPEVYAGEQGAIHHAVWPDIEKALTKERLYISVDNTLSPMTDKEVRARPMQSRTQRRKLFLSQDTSDRPQVYDQLEKEMLQFPNGTHDDTVDCVAWACRLAQNISLPRMRQPPRHKSWKDELKVSSGPRSFMAG